MKTPDQRLFEATESLEVKEFTDLYHSLRDQLTASVKEEALRIACLHEKPDIASFLLGEGVDVDCADAHGQTPLMFSVENLHVKLVSLLLSNGAIVDLQDSNGASALFRAVDVEIQMAAQQSSPHRVEAVSTVSRALLEFGADPNLKNHSGSSPLSIASLNRFQHFIALVEMNRAAEEVLKKQ